MPSYTTAFEELKQIILEIEKGEISVDILSEKINRAIVLIKICKDKLTSVEEDVNEVLRQLDDKNG